MRIQGAQSTHWLNCCDINIVYSKLSPHKGFSPIKPKLHDTIGSQHSTGQGLSQDLSSLSFGQTVSWKHPFWTGKIHMKDFPFY